MSVSREPNNMERIDPALYSAAGYCKKIGFTSLKQCAEMLDKPANTLGNWRNNNIKLFECAVIGAKAVLDAKKHKIVD